MSKTPQERILSLKEMFIERNEDVRDVISEHFERPHAEVAPDGSVWLSEPDDRHAGRVLEEHELKELADWLESYVTPE